VVSTRFWAALVAVASWSATSRAAEPGAEHVTLPEAPSPSAARDADQGARLPSTPLPPLGGEYRLMAGAAVGRGIRFENPYRLQTELGSNAESLSLTATYFDLSLGALLAGGDRIFHGVVVHGSFALDGITQEVVTPSYLFLYRPDPRWAVLGRAGFPIVIEPDANVGFEVAGGGIFYLTAALGLSASLIGSMFFAAGTLDSARPAIPILSMELGAVYDYEVLP
jgi:hypothetical protein